MTATGYTIRRAFAADAPLLPPIERSAAALFRTIAALEWLADAQVQSVKRHQELIENGAAWVADAAGCGPVGFLNGEPLNGAFHIWEMSVHADHQHRGLGAQLLATARVHATAMGYKALTLTTFRDVEWNEHFYRRFGFKAVASAELTGALAGILQQEGITALPRDRRLAMILPLD